MKLAVQTCRRKMQTAPVPTRDYFHFNAFFIHAQLPRRSQCTCQFRLHRLSMCVQCAWPLASHLGSQRASQQRARIIGRLPNTHK